MSNNSLKNKIAFIIPYFGKFPDYFNFWLKTAGCNDNVDFLIFTDDERNFDYPSNVKVHYITFMEMKAYIQEKFSFRISLEHPYKLCDFRLAYGYIFEEYLKSYDFWGHCDLDVIWGNIKSFLTDEILDNYDKILEHGHCELYRNTENINRRFMMDNHPFVSYKEVLSTNASFCFDEKTSPMNRNLWKNFKVYTNDNLFINTKYNDYSGCFKDANSNKIGFLCWRNGNLIYHCEKYSEQVVMYAHFQYRNPSTHVDEKESSFVLMPTGFFPKEKRTAVNQFLFGLNIKAKKIIIKNYIYKILYVLGFNRDFKRMFMIPSRFTYKKYWKGEFVK